MGNARETYHAQEAQVPVWEGALDTPCTLRHSLPSADQYRELGGLLSPRHYAVPSFMLFPVRAVYCRMT